MDNVHTGAYVYLYPQPAYAEPERRPNDVTHAVPRFSIYDRTDYLVNMDLTITRGLAYPLLVSAETEPLRVVNLPPNDSRPIYTPLAVWRSKVPLDRR